MTEDWESLQIAGDRLADDALAKLDSLPLAAWPARLVELAEVITAELARLRVAPEAAQHQARHVVAALALYCGGRPLYLPRGSSLKTALLHQSIYLEAKAGNTDELARRHGLTTRAVQRIVADQAKLHRARRAREALP